MDKEFIAISVSILAFIILSGVGFAVISALKSRTRSFSSELELFRSETKARKKREVARRRTAESRGKAGEDEIATVFEELAEKGFVGATVRNVYVPKEDGTYSEIDVIFVTPKGLFVVESKNYSGWIFGKERDLFWTQKLPTGQSSQFYNPIKQNEGHVRFLKQYLKVPLRIFPVVVFSDHCEIKKLELESSPKPAVIHLRELYYFIVNKFSLFPDALTGELVINVAARLEELTRVSDAAKQAHVERVAGLKGR